MLIQFVIYVVDLLQYEIQMNLQRFVKPMKQRSLYINTSLLLSFYIFNLGWSQSEKGNIKFVIPKPRLGLIFLRS